MKPIMKKMYFYLVLVLIAAPVANAATAPAASTSAAPATKSSSCSEKIANLYLAGDFVMPASGEKMNLWIGKPKDIPNADPTDASLKDKTVWGVLESQASGAVSGGICEAQCKVIRFERFKRDRNPALMELMCEGSRLHTLKMPLHVEWQRAGGDKFTTTVRLGSSLYGIEQAPLNIQVDRYSMNTPALNAVSGIAKPQAQPMVPAAPNTNKPSGEEKKQDEKKPQVNSNK